MPGRLEDHPNVGPVNPVFSTLALAGIVPIAAGVGPGLARFLTGNPEIGNSTLETGLIVGGIADFILFGTLALMFRSQSRS